MKKLEKFRAWVEQIMPHAYSDTEAYYKVLDRMIEYLNDVIEQGNEMVDYNEDTRKDFISEARQLKVDFERARQFISDKYDDSKQHVDDTLLETKEWVENSVLPESVGKQLEEWYTNGRLETIINEDVFTGLTAQLAQTATKSELQGLSMSYKESYDTLSELQAAYPNGDEYNHAVLSDGMIYTYRDSWVNTGIQANGTGVPLNSLPKDIIEDVAFREFLNNQDCFNYIEAQRNHWKTENNKPIPKGLKVL